MPEVYNKGRERYTAGLGNWGTDDIRVLMLSDVYVFNATHANLAAINPAAILFEASIDPGTRSGVDGYLDGGSALFTDVDRNIVCSSLVVYEAVSTTLILFSNDAGGLPIQLFPDSQYLVLADRLFGGYGRL